MSIVKKKYTHLELIEWLRKDSEKETQKALAKRLGISAQYLSDILKGRREPGQKMLDALGLERVITYESKKVSQS